MSLAINYDPLNDFYPGHKPKRVLFNRVPPFRQSEGGWDWERVRGRIHSKKPELDKLAGANLHVILDSFADGLARLYVKAELASDKEQSAEIIESGFPQLFKILTLNKVIDKIEDYSEWFNQPFNLVLNGHLDENGSNLEKKEGAITINGRLASQDSYEVKLSRGGAEFIVFKFNKSSDSIEYTVPKFTKEDIFLTNLAKEVLKFMPILASKEWDHKTKILSVFGIITECKNLIVVIPPYTKQLSEVK